MFRNFNVKWSRGEKMKTVSIKQMANAMKTIYFLLLPNWVDGSELSSKLPWHHHNRPHRSQFWTQSNQILFNTDEMKILDHKNANQTAILLLEFVGDMVILWMMETINDIKARHRSRNTVNGARTETTMIGIQFSTASFASMCYRHAENKKNRLNFS